MEMDIKKRGAWHQHNKCVLHLNKCMTCFLVNEIQSFFPSKTLCLVILKVPQDLKDLETCNSL